MKVEKYALLFLLMLFCYLAHSKKNTKDSLRIKEFYVQFNSLLLTNSGFQYKAQIGSRTLFKLAVYDIRYNQSKNISESVTTFPTIRTSANINGAFGMEKRKQIGKITQLFGGVNLLFGLNWSRFKIDNPAVPANQRFVDGITYSIGFSYNMGVLIKLTSKFHIGAEIEPNFMWSYTRNKRSLGLTRPIAETFDRSLKLDNTIFKILLLYRWNKK